MPPSAIYSNALGPPRLSYDEFNHGLLQRAHGGQQLRFAVHDLFFHFLFHTTECNTRLFLEVVFIFLQQVPPASFMLPGCTAVAHHGGIPKKTFNETWETT